MLPQLPSMRALLLLAVLAYYAPTSRAGSEHLLFHELNDDIVAVTAAYTAHRTGSGHDTTFPRSISSLLDSFPIQELNLTLTRGRWREEWCDTAAGHLTASISASVPCAVCGIASSISQHTVLTYIMTTKKHSTLHAGVLE